MHARFLRFFLLLPLFACAALAAQTPPAPLVQEREPLDPRKNQKVERIHVEDDAVKIDEIRYAGQAERVTVQPKKSNMPGYEIQPEGFRRSRPADNRDGLSSATGKRLWNVFGF